MVMLGTATFGLSGPGAGIGASSRPSVFCHSLYMFGGNLTGKMPKAVSNLDFKSSCEAG